MIKKILFLVLLFVVSTMANSVKPTTKIVLSGGVTDMVRDTKNLYISTVAGKVDIVDIKRKKSIKVIKLKKIKDFVGELMPPKIYSVDVKDGTVLLVSQAPKGYSEIYQYKNDKLENIISKDKKIFVLRAKYIDKNKILFATISNELFAYDIAKKKLIWKNHVSYSKFSSFKMDKLKKRVVVSDESGDIKLHNIEDGRLLKKFSKNNLDNVFQLDFVNDTIITAGQDMKAFVIDVTTGDSYVKKADFLVYSCSLSSDGKLGAFSKYQNNDVQIFDIDKKTDIVKLVGNKMNITNIIFLNNHEIFVSSDAKQLNYYNLKK